MKRNHGETVAGNPFDVSLTQPINFWGHPLVFWMTIRFLVLFSHNQITGGFSIHRFPLIFSIIFEFPWIETWLRTRYTYPAEMPRVMWFPSSSKSYESQCLCEIHMFVSCHVLLLEYSSMTSWLLESLKSTHFSTFVSNMLWWNRSFLMFRHVFLTRQALAQFMAGKCRSELLNLRHAGVTAEVAQVHRGSSFWQRLGYHKSWEKCGLMGTTWQTYVFLNG